MSTPETSLDPGGSQQTWESAKELASLSVGGSGQVEALPTLPSEPLTETSSVIRPDFHYPEPGPKREVAPLSQVKTRVRVPAKPRSSHSHPTRWLAVGLAVAAGVVGLAHRRSDSSDARAEGETPTGETVDTPSTINGVTPDTTVHVTHGPETTTVVLANPEFRHVTRELNDAEKDYLSHVSGFGLNGLKIAETGELDTSHGKIILAGIDGAQPPAGAEEEIAREAALFDRLASEQQVYKTTIRPAVGTGSVSVAFRVVPSERPDQYVIFANSTRNLAYPVYNVKTEVNPVAFTDVSGRKKGLPVVTLIQEAVATDANAKVVNLQRLTAEMAHARALVIIEPAEVERLRAQPDGLSWLPSFSSNPTFEDRIDALTYYLREGFANGVAEAAVSPSWEAYQKTLQYPLALSEAVFVPPQPLPRAVFDSMHGV